MNADLSPAELKALLKRVKGDAVSYRTYISALENEINLWRSGKAVPEIQWASIDNAAKGKAPVVAPGFKLPEDNRPATPAVTKDEKDEFLKREQELLEQINEKVLELQQKTSLVDEMQTNMEQLKQHDKEFSHQNKQMSSELNAAKLQIEKDSYEKKEGEIYLDSLKEANLEYVAELEEIKATLSQLKQEQEKNQEDIDHTQGAVVSFFFFF